MNCDHFGPKEYCLLPILESLLIGSPSDFPHQASGAWVRALEKSCQIGQIELFVHAKNKTLVKNKKAHEWSGVTCVKMLLVIESQPCFPMNHPSSCVKHIEVLGDWRALMECQPNDWNVEIYNWKHTAISWPRSSTRISGTVQDSSRRAEACVRLGTAVVFMVIEAVIWGGCGQRLSSAET